MTQPGARPTRRLKKMAGLATMNVAAASTLILGQFLSASASSPMDGAARDFAADVIAPAQMMLDARIDGAISTSASVSQQTIDEHEAQSVRILARAKDLGTPRDEEALFAARASGARDALMFSYGEPQIRAMMASVDQMEGELIALGADLQAELVAAGMDDSLAPEIGYRAIISGICDTYSNDTARIEAFANFVNSDGVFDACFKNGDCQDTASIASLQAMLKASRITEAAAGFAYNDEILSREADEAEARNAAFATDVSFDTSALEALGLFQPYAEDEDVAAIEDDDMFSPR